MMCGTTVLKHSSAVTAQMISIFLKDNSNDVFKQKAAQIFTSVPLSLSQASRYQENTLDSSPVVLLATGTILKKKKLQLLQLFIS
jgi:hypothetical protein